MKENKDDKFKPNENFQLSAAIRWWENNANNSRGGNFNVDLYLRYLKTVHK